MELSRKELFGVDIGGVGDVDLIGMTHDLDQLRIFEVYGILCEVIFTLYHGYHIDHIEHCRRFALGKDKMSSSKPRLHHPINSASKSCTGEYIIHKACLHYFNFSLLQGNSSRESGRCFPKVGKDRRSGLRWRRGKRSQAHFRSFYLLKKALK